MMLQDPVLDPALDRWATHTRTVITTATMAGDSTRLTEMRTDFITLRRKEFDLTANWEGQDFVGREIEIVSRLVATLAPKMIMVMFSFVVSMLS